MSLLPDWMIERDVKIDPFSPQQKRPGVISYGVSSFGYDVRLGYKFKVFTPAFLTGAVIDPKNFDPKAFVEVDLTPHTDDWTYDGIQWRCGACGYRSSLNNTHTRDGVNYCRNKQRTHARKPDHIVIPPHSFVLGESVERFSIPRDVTCVALGKSTYARCSLVVNVTPGEAGWSGKWTIELSNTAPMPVKVYCGEGIMQCLFLRGEAACRTDYAEKGGKYMHQDGLTLPKVDGDNK